MSVLIVAVVLAWAAILLLGLAVGGLLAQIRAINARMSSPRRAPRVGLRSVDASSIASGPFAAVFADTSCDVCHRTIPELVARIDGGRLLVVTDGFPADWGPLPPGVEEIPDPNAAQRAGVPALPWFTVVDQDGQTVESFALGNTESVRRAAELAHGLIS